MKKQKADISKRMREEAKQWQKFKEEQRALVSQLKAKIDSTNRIAEEAKAKEKSVNAPALSFVLGFILIA
jgi:predicted Fe-S protein YdhL (DUF1289 family)